MTHLDKCVLPKRLKLDKGFRPCVVQAGEEVYPNGVFEFNITRLVAFIQEQADRFPVEPVELSELPDYGESPSLNEEVVRRQICRGPFFWLSFHQAFTTSLMAIIGWLKPGAKVWWRFRRIAFNVPRMCHF